MGSRYYPELDFLRGWAIMGVLVIHTAGRVIGLADDELLRNTAAVLGQLARFSVPVFIFISSVLVAMNERPASPQEGRMSRKPFLKKAWTLLVPYVAWVVLGEMHRAPFSATHFVLSLMTGQGYYYQLYFIPLILQFYLLSPFFTWVSTNRRRTTILGGVIVASNAVLLAAYQLYAMGYLHVAVHEKYRAIIPLLLQSTAPAWVIYALAGYLLGFHYEHFSRRLRQMPAAFILLLVGATTALLLADYRLGIGITHSLGGAAGTFMRPTVVLYSFGVLLVLGRLGMRNGLGATATVSIGRRSFGVFLLHLAIQRDLIERWVPSLFQTWTGGLLAYALILFASLALTAFGERIPFVALFLGSNRRSTHHKVA